MTQQEYEQKKRECYEEFKKEICFDSIHNRYYFDKVFNRAYTLGKQEKDAQEEEMLMCEKSRVQKIFAGQTEAQKSTPCGTILHHEAAAKAELLYTLFGSKCLPDKEPKPAEPKYKQGDKVFNKLDCNVYEVICRTGFNHYALKDFMSDVHEDFLEPYTEPAEPTCTRTCTDDCPSQHKIPCVNLSQETANCDKCNGLKLHIAAMAMQGLLASPVDANMQSKSVDYIVKASFEYADALIAEAEKGGNNE